MFAGEGSSNGAKYPWFIIKYNPEKVKGRKKIVGYLSSHFESEIMEY